VPDPARPHRGISSPVHRGRADLVSTNTFNGTRISQADYQTESFVPEINRAAAEICVRAARWGIAQFQRRIFVAGTLGPTNRTLSMSPDVNRPDYRAVTWAQVVAAYAEQARALIQGGVDALLVETIFDTLNAKAALFAIEGVFDETWRTPSGDDLGDDYRRFRRTLSAKPSPPSTTPSAMPALFRRAQLRARRPPDATLHRGTRGPRRVLRHLLPECRIAQRVWRYDETPADMAAVLAEFADAGFVNLVGGCCGSTPDYIRAIAAAVRGKKPSRPAGRRPRPAPERPGAPARCLS